MLDGVTIERALKLAQGTPLLVALSGGGDSLALLHLVSERLAPDKVATLTIDHALRAGSDRDARRAFDMAGEAGVAKREILSLTWPPGAKPGQDAARTARYVALCSHAKSVGARVIVLGHTRDDQAETVLLRAARGSGWRGLAGMRRLAPAPVWPQGRGLWLARPLLGARREALRMLLWERAVDWIEDPANENSSFARVRARAGLAKLARVGFDPMRLAALADRFLPLALKLDADAGDLVDRTAAFDADTITVRRAGWMDASAPVRRRALGALVAAAAGAVHEPPADKLAVLEAQLAAPGFPGATLGGAWLQPAPGAFRISRDVGALSGRADGAGPLPPTKLGAGVETVWDGRVILTASEPGWNVVVLDGGAWLARGEERRPLAQAGARWLLKERVRHALGLGAD